MGRFKDLALAMTVIVHTFTAEKVGVFEILMPPMRTALNQSSNREQAHEEATNALIDKRWRIGIRT